MHSSLNALFDGLDFIPVLSTTYRLRDSGVACFIPQRAVFYTRRTLLSPVDWFNAGNLGAGAWSRARRRAGVTRRL